MINKHKLLRRLNLFQINLKKIQKDFLAIFIAIIKLKDYQKLDQKYQRRNKNE